MCAQHRLITPSPALWEREARGIAAMATAPRATVDMPRTAPRAGVHALCHKAGEAAHDGHRVGRFLS
jgi:hypothetical protein